MLITADDVMQFSNFSLEIIDDLGFSFYVPLKLLHQRIDLACLQRLYLLLDSPFFLLIVAVVRFLQSILLEDTLLFLLINLLEVL